MNNPTLREAAENLAAAARKHDETHMFDEEICAVEAALVEEMGEPEAWNRFRKAMSERGLELNYSDRVSFMNGFNARSGGEG